MDPSLIAADGKDGYYLDFGYNPKSGELLEVPVPEENNGRQRTTIAAFFQRGTIPGAEDEGADWTNYMTGDLTIVDIDNQVKMSIEKHAGSALMNDSAVPVYIPNRDGTMNLNIMSLGDNS